MPQKPCTETELAHLAKKFREASGNSRAEAARELGVSHTALTNAEEDPERSLTKLRIRIIEAYSPHKVVGPRYWLE